MEGSKGTVKGWRVGDDLPIFPGGNEQGASIIRHAPVSCSRSIVQWAVPGYDHNRGTQCQMGTHSMLLIVNGSIGFNQARLGDWLVMYPDDDDMHLGLLGGLRPRLRLSGEMNSGVKSGDQRGPCLLYTSPSPRDRG